MQVSPSYTTEDYFNFLNLCDGKAGAVINSQVRKERYKDDLLSLSKRERPIHARFREKDKKRYFVRETFSDVRFKIADNGPANRLKRRILWTRKSTRNVNNRHRWYSIAFSYSLFARFERKERARDVSGGSLSRHVSEIFIPTVYLARVEGGGEGLPIV